MRHLPLFFLALSIVACDCGEPPGGGGGPTVNRCEYDIENSPLFSRVGTGVSAKFLESDDQGIGGQTAWGRTGDVLVENDRIRVVIQRPDRHIAPTPYGGFLIDADLKREGPGRDQFGKLSFFYAFGRTVNATDIEIVDDGSNGGPAVVAVTGLDAVNDFVNLQNVISDYLPATKLVVDPAKDVPIRATTYYVLSPGENRVRILTNFCNDGNTPVQIPLGELIEQGGTSSFFNPTGCANRPGFTARDGDTRCLVDSMKWVGYQADGVAYGFRGYKTSNLHTPEDRNAIVGIAGVAGILAGGEDQTGLLSWTDPAAKTRPGAFAIGEAGSKPYLRDFVVARDLGDIHSTFLQLDNQQRARVNVTVNGPGAASSRVEITDTNGKTVTLLVSDTAGKSKVDLVAGSYTFTAGLPGNRVSPPVTVNVPTTGDVTATLTLPTTRKLTVNVKDPNGRAEPAKVTVFCPAGPCPNANAWTRFADEDFFPANVASVALVLTSGSVTIDLPPEQYAVVVTRGPEYSAWPDSWRPVETNTARAVDLTTADQTLNAVIARVVDTGGWMSADLHVHAVNSADTSVPNELRVATYLSEGVDILCSTDHDYVMDFGPVLQALNGTDYMATMVGSEISTFDFGHYNAYPMIRDPLLPNGGAIDWAGGNGPTLRLGQLISLVREKHGQDVVFQMNHPRGRWGALPKMRVDTLTGASHTEASVLRMEPDPTATPTNTRLFSFNFDAMELQNGQSVSNTLMNDWFTWLSTGRVKTATAVSDTHYAWNNAAGYSRTFVKVDADAPSQFSPTTFARRLKAHQASGTNGPFVKVTAQKLDNGAPTGAVAEIGGTLSVSSGSTVELTVDIQGPEWMQFDRIDLYTHRTGRDAQNGEQNSADPVAADSRTLDLSTLPIEAVPGITGDFRRVHVVQKFQTTVTADTWFVLVVRSSSAARIMFPLAWDGTDCNGSGCTYPSVRPFAFTNPVFIDADGTGKYDNFPWVPPAPPPPSQLGTGQQPLSDAPEVPTIEQLNAFLRAMDEHKHE